MINIKILWSIIILLSVIVLSVGYQLVTGSVAIAKDGRTAIILTKNERNFILTEMRGLLSYMQLLVSAFKKLSTNIHTQFGELYNDAVAKRDPDHSLKQVSIIMQNCIACHGAYQLVESAE